jgi:hypothetical protein
VPLTEKEKSAKENCFNDCPKKVETRIEITIITKNSITEIQMFIGLSLKRPNNFSFKSFFNATLLDPNTVTSAVAVGTKSPKRPNSEVIGLPKADLPKIINGANQKPHVKKYTMT